MVSNGFGFGFRDLTQDKQSFAFRTYWRIRFSLELTQDPHQNKPKTRQLALNCESHTQARSQQDICTQDIEDFHGLQGYSILNTLTKVILWANKFRRKFQLPRQKTILVSYGRIHKSAIVSGSYMPSQKTPGNAHEHKTFSDVRTRL